MEIFEKEVIQRLTRIETVNENILKEAKKTNGRVNNLEREVQTLKTSENLNANKIDANKVYIENSKSGKDKWIDRLFNAVIMITVTGFLWLLLATGIINPPV